MLTDTRFAKEQTLADVLTALQFVSTRHDLWAELAGVVTDEGLAIMREEASRMASFLSSKPDMEDIAGRMAYVLAPRVPMGLPAIRPAANGTASRSEALMAKAKKVEWEIHKKNGKKTHWTARWNGLRLKVEVKKLPPPDKTVFIGYIDDQEVTRGKLKSRVDAEVEGEALRRFIARGS